MSKPSKWRFVRFCDSSRDLLVCPTGSLYRSTDGGQTWTSSYDCYCRAVWVDPAEPDHSVLGPADGGERNGRIEESREGGKGWSTASAGMAALWPRSMVERFAQVGDALLAVRSDDQLLAAPLSAISWRRILPDIANVNAATAMAE